MDIMNCFKFAYKINTSFCFLSTRIIYLIQTLKSLKFEEVETRFQSTSQILLINKFLL